MSEHAETIELKHDASEGGSREVNLWEDCAAYLKAYARQKPEMAALWCFGVGFALGWKLKPW